MNPREAYIALNMIDHVGPVRVKRLLERFGQPQAILAASAKELMQVEGVGAEVAKAITGWQSQADLDTELKRIADFGARVLTLDDPDYPANLREIYDPPLALYVKGTLEPRDKHAIAIVGSRQTTYYGLESARKLAYQLAYAGMTIVSGLARGIDSAAHQGALAANGRTLAVLGTGLDIVYPPENGALYEKIASGGGAIMTQFPFGVRPDTQHFPLRNRIVSGLSLGIIVVEAGVPSGALITANMALDQGRQVFAVPGKIDSPQSKGCHRLIKSGAKLVEDAEDVLSEFEDLFPKSSRPDAPPADAPTLELSQAEQKVFDAMGDDETDLDHVIRQSGLTSAEVFATLLRLEMRRLVRQLPGKRFVRVKA
ncbi:MAG: DNA-processing protein DprA [Verrucomicrobiia bacterium]|jgi:DNA processing protein